MKNPNQSSKPPILRLLIGTSIMIYFTMVCPSALQLTVVLSKKCHDLRLCAKRGWVCDICLSIRVFCFVLSPRSKLEKDKAKGGGREGFINCCLSQAYLPSKQWWGNTFELTGSRTYIHSPDTSSSTDNVAIRTGF